MRKFPRGGLTTIQPRKTGKVPQSAMLGQRGGSSREDPMTSSPRFPAPWTVEQIPSGYKVLDANDQALAYIYARESKAAADIAKVLTFDEARRIAVNVAKPICCWP